MKELEEWALRFGFTQEEIDSSLKTAAFEGIEVTADWLLLQLTEEAGDALAKRYKEAAGPTKAPPKDGFRPIVIDGCNVAMSYGLKERFSCMGIRKCVDYFKKLGHTDINVIMPSYFKDDPKVTSSGVRIIHQEVLKHLEDDGMIFWTPSAKINGRLVVCYDDRFILGMAQDKDGVIISNDEYRDLVKDDEELRTFVEDRLLMYAFLGTTFMVPDDTLGDCGPDTASLLRVGPKSTKGKSCPYGIRCTYGIHCKYAHDVLA
ncbi:hypothetical protein L596_009175 [Steinernema carpocapsae]|uniref:RNase NYN domain-containing protein n=1 Tax=Steinernema carpocapsae TaxID=34508 RepID=A0A4U5PEK9_STECR|nr:hypothetical protein L596_009175 [Steinernema carpocapsae]